MSIIENTSSAVLSNSKNDRNLLGDLLGAFTFGLIGVGQSAAFAAMMFPGELSPALSIGIPICLASTGILVIIIACLSSFPTSMANIQEAGLAIVASGVLVTMTRMNGATLEAKVATALVIYVSSTLITGGLLWLMGRLSLGSFVYLLPFPVVAGFLAGSGWLIVSGGFTVVTGLHPGLAMLLALARPELMQVWIPAVCFALIFLILLKRVKHFLTAPLGILAGIIIFHVYCCYMNVSLDEARILGWLPAVTAPGGLPLKLSFSPKNCRRVILA